MQCRVVKRFVSLQPTVTNIELFQIGVTVSLRRRRRLHYCLIQKVYFNLLHPHTETDVDFDCTGLQIAIIHLVNCSLDLKKKREIYIQSQFVFTPLSLREKRVLKQKIAFLQSAPKMCYFQCVYRTYAEL